MLMQQLHSLLEQGWRLAFAQSRSHRRAMRLGFALRVGAAHHLANALCFGPERARLERRL